MKLPTPEGTSNALPIVAGQISGIIFMSSTDAMKAPGGSMTASLLELFALTVTSLALTFFLKESPISTQKDVQATQTGK
jgi:hypothetical protein